MSTMHLPNTSAAIERKYRAEFESEAWAEHYTIGRQRRYSELLDVVKRLGCRRVLDVGCAFGLFVEMANAAGIDAYGVDFEIAELQKFHQQLPFSNGKFFYGAVETAEVLSRLAEKKFDSVVVCHTLRYFQRPSALLSLQPDRFIVQEVSNSARMRKKRAREFDVRLYSATELLSTFDGYELNYLYCARFFAGFSRPSRVAATLLNSISPTYTAILTRAC